jgi:periplasmic copper chaperone A
MKTKRVAVLVATGSLLVPAAAQAHISLHPNTIPAGAFATLEVRVPGEQEGAHVTKVDVLFPAGFTDVDYESVPGWDAKVTDRKLATPIQAAGETIDTEVEQIAWTWTGPLGRVDNGQFIQFPLSVSIPAGASGKALEFRTVQSYSDGQIVHWIDPSLSAEHPSPRINVTAKGGVIEDLAGDEAGPEAGQTGAQGSARGFSSAPVAAARSGDDASEELGIVALVIGSLGLLAGLAALAVSRRRGAGAA